ncbi:type I-E CRISPR-associated protein Cas6/Cse3/CasE [Synechococcus sp. R55.6]|uniref:type I-E CRISPR-associated protein Cas6/Cse3/CasE n=1 Tax=unclassified Synechococcus TaxID=2626047 RepID=UPI0039C3B728
MYLSRLVLNERQLLVQRDLSNSHALHQRIMHGFPDQPTQTPRSDWCILYRQEPDGYTILVQSAIQPDWSRLPKGYVQRDPEVKTFDLTAEVLAKGKCFRFRLRANPSKRDKKTHKIVGFFRFADQLEWLCRQGQRHGFEVLAAEGIPSPNIFGIKKEIPGPVRIYTVLFQGILRVTDAEVLVKAVQQGIGRGRSYGCGLLSLSKISHSAF